METIKTMVLDLISGNSFIWTFVVLALITVLANALGKLFKGRIHPSAIGIFLGLVMAYVCGAFTGGSKGAADVALFAGVGVLGGSSFRDFTIISTAHGAKFSEIKKCGLASVIALFAGVISAYVVGAVIALCFGYKDAASVATIAAGTVTFVVGPVTGAAVGAESGVIAISVAAGLIKSVAVMILTPICAKRIGLTTPQAAMIYGGLMGTTSGTAAGLAATDEKLVPYGAMTATFYTGLGCLLCPSVLYTLTKFILGN